ncbi:Unknown protein, partial [Striga hermonthica]
FDQASALPSFSRIRWGLRLSTILIITMLPCLRYVLSVSARNGRRSILCSSGPNMPIRVCTCCPVLVCADRCSVISQVIYITRSVSDYSVPVSMLPRSQPDHPVLPQATVVAQFRDYHAEKFSGQGDPHNVDEWIQGLELIFEVRDCPDIYRVICAQLQLTGDARLWWNAYWSMRPGEKEGCTWDRLKELIREKYYPTYYRAEMERQFLSLKQGTRSVDEYEREFTRLAAFVPDLVRTEAQRAQRFIDGLYPAVRHNIVGHGTQTYARAVSITQGVDASIRREAIRDRPQPSAPA